MPWNNFLHTEHTEHGLCWHRKNKILHREYREHGVCWQRKNKIYIESIENMEYIDQGKIKFT